MDAKKLLTMTAICFVGAAVGLYLLMRSIAGDDVPTLAIVTTVFAFAGLMGWVGSR